MNVEQFSAYIKDNVDPSPHGTTLVEHYAKARVPGGVHLVEYETHSGQAVVVLISGDQHRVVMVDGEFVDSTTNESPFDGIGVPRGQEPEQDDEPSATGASEDEDEDGYTEMLYWGEDKIVYVPKDHFHPPRLQLDDKRWQWTDDGWLSDHGLAVGEDADRLTNEFNRAVWDFEETE